MRIMSNLSALLAVNTAKALEHSSAKAMRRLANGLRIGTSSDDAAGMAISEKLRAQVRGLDQAVRNSQDGVSLLQTAEGGLNETHALLQRIRELSVQAANDTLTLQDRSYIQQEVEQLKEQIDLIASTTQFNRKRLLSGDASVLWSTDSAHIKVFVDGSLRSKDMFGQTVVNEGNFQLRITPTAGEGQVQKTNIFYLKHGTVSENVQFSPESGAFSGLRSLQSLHLIDGDYRLETREVPFGGISYHLANGAETLDPATTLGVLNMEASALPDILPYGEYQVRVADEVPFMAYYGSVSGGVEGTDVIDRVDPMGRADVDLAMSASAVGGAVNSQSSLAWTDIGGAGNGTVNVAPTGVPPIAPGGDPFPHDAQNIQFQYDENFDANLWTHFRVTGTQSRETLTNDIALNTYYRSEAGAQAQLGLTYRAVATDQVNLQTTFQTHATTSVRINRSDFGGINLDVNVSNMDIEQAATALRNSLTAQGWWNAAAPAGSRGIEVSVQTIGDQRRLAISHDIAGVTVDVSDLTPGAADLGLAVGGLNNGVTHQGTLRDYERNFFVNVDGMTVVDAVDELNDAVSAAYNINFAANVVGDTRRLDITNGSGGFGVLQGGHRLHVVSAGAAGDEIFVQELGISGVSLGPGTPTGEYGRVLHGYTATVNIGNMHLDAIHSALQGAATTAFNLDSLDDPTGNVFQLETPSAGRRQINLRTDSVVSRYEMSVVGLSGLTVNELFGGNQTLARNAADHDGQVRDFGFDYATLAAGQNIEELHHTINTDPAFGILSASWNTQPDYDGEHYGQFQIQNNDGTPERREVVFSGGSNQLLGGGASVSLLAGNTRNTNTWQARDNVSLTTTWLGIRADGTSIPETIDNTIVLWEGERGNLNSLVTNPALPFTSVYIPDSSGAADLAVGDSWALFTSARSAGAHDRLDFRIRDGVTGSTYDSASLGTPNHGAATYGGGSMVFNNNVLDAVSAGTFELPHLFRTGVGTFNTSSSRVSFVDGGLDGIGTFNNILRTAERYGASAAGWDVGGQANDRWYARTWYGEDTSYYLAGKDPASVLPPGAIEVWRQEDVNASLLFTTTGLNQYRVEVKGYTRSGARVETPLGGGVDIDLNAHGTVSESNPLILNIGGEEIRFVRFAPVGTQIDDKFVVNIAARAGSTYENTTPGVAGAFLSDSIVTIDANPWGLGGAPSRTMEYRFDAGVENGMTMQLMGFFVDPNNSNSTTNVATGELLLNVAGGGFAAGTQAGEGAGWMPYITAEVNYQGRTTPEAGAIVNSFFFQDIKGGEGERDFLERIEYAIDETKNAVLLFDVLEVRNGSALFRVQGHVMERDGTYRYMESEIYGLNEKNLDVNFFLSPDFDGLHFNYFDFTNLSRLREGDRFTLSLVADGRDELDPITNRYAVDEINLFGGHTDPGLYPISWRFNDGVLDNGQTVLHTYQVAPAPFNFGMNGELGGKVYDGTLSLSFGDFHGGTPTGDPGSDDTPRVVRDAATFSSVYREGIDGGVAHRYSRLRDMAQFWDANGNFLLDQPASILIRQGDREARLTLYENDEIHTVLDRLNHLIYNELGDGMMKHLMYSSSDATKFATFAGQLAGINQMDAVQGTMILRSALAGAKGEYSFSGDERILNALGMTVISAAKENTYTLSITDAHSERSVARGLKVTGGQEIQGVWGDAVRLAFDSLLGVIGIQYSKESGKFVAGMSSQVLKTVHLADNSTVLQIGANEGEDLLLSFGAMDAKTLGVSGVRVTDRESAGRAITLVDRAIDKVSRQRAQIGALTNRLGNAASALAVASENLSAADSRLRDLDYAKEMMNFVRIQILTQANMSMMSQANQLPRNVLSLLGQ